MGLTYTAGGRKRQKSDTSELTPQARCIDKGKQGARATCASSRLQQERGVWEPSLFPTGMFKLPPALRSPLKMCRSSRAKTILEAALGGGEAQAVLSRRRPSSAAAKGAAGTARAGSIALTGTTGGRK